VLAAHNTYHEVLTHLGFTHLLSEPVLLAAVRNLAATTRSRWLLRRHFEGTFSINKLAVELLIQPGKAVEYLIGSDLRTTYPWLAEHRTRYSFRDNYLPTRIARSGTASFAALPVSRRRHAGVAGHRGLGERLRDGLLRVRRRGGRRLRAAGMGGGGLVGGRRPGPRNFGATPGQIASQQDLVDILTMVIWTAGPQHAAVNFNPEGPHVVPAGQPLGGLHPEPTGKDHTEADWLANLPPLDVAVQQFCVMNFLGSIHTHRAGRLRERLQGHRVAKAHKQFTGQLTSIEDTIRTSNRHRPLPYHYLQPSLIPNSTNI